MTTPTLSAKDQLWVAKSQILGQPIRGDDQRVFFDGRIQAMTPPPDPMRMLAEINTRLDGFLDLLTQQNARMHHIEEMLGEILHWIQPKPMATFEDLKAREQGEMLARAIREVSR